MKLSPLPIDQFIEKILDLLKAGKNLVLTAAPGAGKTTRLPPALMKLTEKMILVLEPRRVAALAAAQRIADENHTPLGEKIGYQVRFENRSQANTQLLFITEALLMRKLIQDPELKDVGIVIIDEFHERSLHTDLALGMMYELQQMTRPDLKIIVMSATINARQISQFLGDAPIVDVPGQSFPLTISMQNESQLLNTGPQFIERMVAKIKSASPVSTGDVLVFLPGIGEIERVTRDLEEWTSRQGFSLVKLYGTMPLSEQKKVLLKQPQKKIILSTNVAESALTIDGVTCVIDSGLARTVSLSLSTALPKIQVTRISRASATQRAGRSARQAPGQVHRMWNKMDELSMPEFEVAEILKQDLAESLLLLARLGVREAQSFSWYENPPPRRLQMAVEQLKSWGAIDTGGALTSVGSKMAELPLHPRLARLMIEAEKLHVVQYASEICALLSEKDFFTSREQNQISNSDVQLRWEFLNQNRRSDRFHSHFRLAESIARHFQHSKDVKNPETLLQEILLPAYSDLLCRRRKPGDAKAIRIDGSGVKISDSSSLKHSEFFVAVQLMEGVTEGEALVNIASEISLPLIQKYFEGQIKEVTEISFDEKQQRLNKSSTLMLRQLPLENSRAKPLNENELEEHLPQIALAQWDWLLRENEDLQNWLRRLDWFSRQKLDLTPTELTPDVKLKILTEACYGSKKLQELKDKDLVYFFENHLDPKIVQFFREECPATLLVPTGNRLKLKYFPDKNPVLEVRLQEVFGWNETPKILDGKIPITLHLLAPNYRPLQITQDLANFWRGAYHEVRKELRARYPKHSWPDDPLTAKPVAKGRSQRGHS